MKWTSVVCKKFTRSTDPSMSTPESGREREMDGGEGERGDRGEG